MDQKCTYEKVPKDLGRALRPPHLDKIQKNSSFFSQDTVLQSAVLPIQDLDLGLCLESRY